MANSHNLAFLLLISLFHLLHSQQPYAGLDSLDCTSQSPSVLGNACNGQSTSCRTFLTFHALPPYQTVFTIASLFGSDPSQLARANIVAENATFLNNTKVLVPVKCSCSGLFYQYNVSYSVQDSDTVYIIATDVYQGLTTCSTILTMDNINPDELEAGSSINVPVRCACPTRNQTSHGVKFLLTYLIDPGDTIYMISQKLEAKQKSIEDANEMSETNPNPTIYYPTTLLIPLEKQPIPFQLVAPSPPPPSPSPPALPPPRKSSNHTGVSVGVGAGGAVLVAVLSLIAFYLAKTKKKQDKEFGPIDDSGIYIKQYENSSGMPRTTEDILFGIYEIGQALKVYEYEELRLATKNFSEESRIEGSVYLGVFDGDFAAIKIKSRDICKEIEILKKINHFNLVKLSGVCFNEGRWYLVYEYAENGSLKSWIIDRSISKVLSWIQRVQIALDVATGLNYLHSFTVPAYVHRDINSYNILLDGSFRAKIANFWQARPTDDKDGDFVVTRHIVGTQGYIAPEYLEHGLVSPKLDVYAFGIVLLEMITRKSATEAQQDNAMWLKGFLAALDQEDEGEKLENFIDPLLGGNYPPELALVVARLVQRCLKGDAGSRPTMEDLVQSLSKVLALSQDWSEPKSFSSQEELLGKY